MAIGYGVAAPKPAKTIKQLKARKDRAEAKVKRSVRQDCARRDGPCRFGMPSLEAITLDRRAGAMNFAQPGCAGDSEWAHMHSRRRSQTRNQAPEVRHDTRHSFMVCQLHHDHYDGRRLPRLFVTALTRKGADGPLKFRTGSK